MDAGDGVDSAGDGARCAQLVARRGRDEPGFRAGVQRGARGDGVVGGVEIGHPELAVEADQHGIGTGMLAGEQWLETGIGQRRTDPVPRAQHEHPTVAPGSEHVDRAAHGGEDALVGDGQADRPQRVDVVPGALRRAVGEHHVGDAAVGQQRGELDGTGQWGEVAAVARSEHQGAVDVEDEAARGPQPILCRHARDRRESRKPGLVTVRSGMLGLPARPRSNARTPARSGS